MALLTPPQLARAQRANRYYQRRLGWFVANSPRDIGSAEFAYYIARFQRTTNDLRIDGIVGPKTWGRLRGKTWTPPTERYLIVAGEQVRVPFPVVTFENPEGLSFYGQQGWQPRQDATGAGVNLVVLHWDACASSHDCFHVLLDRGLSVQLMLDADGTVYQALDLAEARAYHARQVNERSVGIEIQNHIDATVAQGPGLARPIVTEATPHTGEPSTHLDFYDIQKTRTLQIVEVLCEIFKIPRQLPTTADGQVSMGLIDPKFSGICGHYHLTTDKVDPGLTLWPPLLAAYPPPPPPPDLSPSATGPSPSPSPDAPPAEASPNAPAASADAPAADASLDAAAADSEVTTAVAEAETTPTMGALTDESIKSSDET